jgi:hypothetical protein
MSSRIKNSPWQPARMAAGLMVVVVASTVGCVPPPEAETETESQGQPLKGRARPTPSESEHRGPLSAQGLTIDAAGYESALCIGAICTGPGREDLPFDLAPGVHQLFAPASTDYELMIPSALGTITVDQAGVATLDSRHFFQTGPHTIRARTVEITLNLHGYPGRFGFDGSGRTLTKPTTRLLVGRHFMMADYESFDMKVDSFGPAQDIAIDFDGKITLGPSVAASFDLVGRTLVARTHDVTFDQKGYQGLMALGSVFKVGQVVTFRVLENRRYYVSDYRSFDAARSVHPFSPTWDLSVDGNGQLQVVGETRRYFNIWPARRRLEPILGGIEVTGTGPLKFCVGGQPLSCACPGDRIVTPMLLGRSFSIHRSAIWVNLSPAGTCSPTQVSPPGGDTLTIACSKAPPLPGDIRNDDPDDGWIRADPGEWPDPNACHSCDRDHDHDHDRNRRRD